jgi:hypothetical protein
MSKMCRYTTRYSETALSDNLIFFVPIADKLHIDAIIRCYHCGFQRNRSAADHVSFFHHTLRRKQCTA